jgi:hypothetical protein
LNINRLKCSEAKYYAAFPSRVRDVALIYYSSCKNSIKPSLQFSCIVVINASKGSLGFQVYKLFSNMLVHAPFEINTGKIEISNFKIQTILLQ